MPAQAFCYRCCTCRNDNVLLGTTEGVDEKDLSAVACYAVSGFAVNNKSTCNLWMITNMQAGKTTPREMS